MSQGEFGRLLSLLVENTTIVPEEALIPHRKRAIALMQDIDPDDALFIACALTTGSTLWSDDKRLKKQAVVTVLNTREVREILEE